MDRQALMLANQMLGEFVGDFKEEVAALKRGGLNNGLSTWFLTREDYDALDETRKALGALLEELNRAVLPEMMAEQNTKTITLADLRRRFTVSERVTCSLLDPDAGMEFLKANGAGGMIKQKVESATLSAWAKRFVQEEGKDLPETIFKLNIMKVMSAAKI